MMSSEQRSGTAASKSAEPSFAQLAEEIIKDSTFQLCSIMFAAVVGITSLFGNEIPLRLRITIAVIASGVLFFTLPTIAKKKIVRVGGGLITFAGVLCVLMVMIIIPSVLMNWIFSLFVGHEFNQWAHSLSSPAYELVDFIGPIILIGGTIFFWVAVGHIYEFSKRGSSGRSAQSR